VGSSSATSVTISTSATTFQTGNTYTFTLTVSNSNETNAGCDIATKFGTLNTSGTGLQKIGSQLTHSTPRALSATWTFTYTAPSSACVDTIFATGNAVNADGSDNGNCTDKWNFASKYLITVEAPPTQTKAISLSRSTVNIGNIRVGLSKADTMRINSTGELTLTVTSTSMKTGTFFSRSPTGTNRTIAAGSNEVNTLTATPTGRGSITDSLIINSDATNGADQRKAVYVTAFGIQGVFSGVTGSPLAFGNAKVNTFKTKSYVYQNTGDDTLFMQQPSISGSAFTILTQPTRLNLAPNERDSVVVKFLPTNVTPQSGTLSF
jgi:hypothetical protein